MIIQVTIKQDDGSEATTPYTTYEAAIGDLSARKAELDERIAAAAAKAEQDAKQTG